LSPEKKQTSATVNTVGIGTALRSWGSKGKPKGSKNRVTRVVEELLEDRAQDLTRRLIQRAMGGSTEAMKIAFGIITPPRRDRFIEVDLPKIETMADLVRVFGDGGELEARPC
jgi:hypothetical protein